MAIEEKVQTKEEIQQEKQEVKSKRANVADAFLADIGLATEDEPKKRSQKKEESAEPEEEPEEEAEDAEEDEEAEEDEGEDEEAEEDEEAAEDDDESETEEESDEKEEEESEAEEDEEDLIPRSKVQKRFDELTSQLKELRRENRRLASKIDSNGNGEQREDEDPDLAKLRKMSVAQLKELRIKVRVASKEADSEEAIRKYAALEDKIEDTIHEAPVRFQRVQLQNFHSAVRETVETVGEKRFMKAKDQIFAMAKQIFSKSSTLQGSPTGQAEAWEMAVDKWEAQKKSSDGDDEKRNLKRTVNKLKKKTSLDSSTLKGGSQQVSKLDKLKKRAVHGNLYDKENYVKEALDLDAFIPDEFK